METRRRTWFDARGLTIASSTGERTLPVYAGALHYWRVPPSTWASSLRTLHALGLTMVETCVPWRVHAAGAAGAAGFDFTGARDLGAFLDAAHAAGLAAIVRPGPQVNAELTSLGLPDDVLADPACQARSAHGTPVWMPAPPRAFPIPSYASRAFRARVHAWYAAVAELVRPRLAPDGPVVAIGVDHDAPWYFRGGAFDQDYHPDALAWFTESTGVAEAPRAWGDPAVCAAWVRFKEHALARALGEFAKLLDDVGLGGVARFHDLAAGMPGLVDRRAIQAAIGGPVGLDASTPRAGLPALRRTAIAFAGDAAPLPIAFDVGVGRSAWLPPLDPPGAADDPTRERDQLLVLLAGGMRGFNLSMAVARDRWSGAAIERDTVTAKWISPLLAALADVAWPSLRPARARVALIASRADGRFGLASSELDPVSPVLAQLVDVGPGGFAEFGRDPGAVAAHRWHDAIARALELAQVPYAIVDEGASEEELAAYRAVIAPTFDRVDRGLWKRLTALAEHKRAIVVHGPQTPTRDELDQPLGEPAPRRAGKLRPGSLDDLPGLAADLAGLAGELADAWQIERPDDVRAFAHADAAGAVRVVFVHSASPRAQQAVLYAECAELRDPFTHEQLRVVGGKVTIPLAPFGIRMLLT